MEFGRRLEAVLGFDYIDKAEYSRAVCICHPLGLRVDNIAYFSMQLDPEDEEFIMLKRDQKEFVDKSTRET